MSELWKNTGNHPVKKLPSFFKGGLDLRLGAVVLSPLCPCSCPRPMIWAPIFTIYCVTSSLRTSREVSFFLGVSCSLSVVGMFPLVANLNYFVKFPSPKKQLEEVRLFLISLPMCFFSLYRIPKCRKNSLCQRCWTKYLRLKVSFLEDREKKFSESEH